MRLAHKLSLVLGATLIVLLCGTLYLSYRFQTKQMERGQRFLIEKGLKRAASRCLPGDLHADMRCLAGLRTLKEGVLPEALANAFVLDAQWRLRAHTEFLKGGFSLKGKRMKEGWVGRGIESDVILEQEGALPGSDEPGRAFSIPVKSKRGRSGTLFALYTEKGLRASLDWYYWDARRRLIQGALLGSGIGVLLALGLAMHFLTPLRPFLDAADSISEGRFSVRVPESRSDELGEMAKKFNSMALRLAELDKLKDDFIRKVTHDLRNPLSTVVTSAELLHEGYQGPLNDKQRESAKAILESSTALAELIDNILDVARIESGRMTFEPAALELPSAAESVLGTLKVRADELHITLERLLPPDITTVYADPEAFRRVLTNLVSNALRFTPDKGVVSLAAHRDGAGNMVFVVSDTGVGIPKERLPGIFEKFSRVPETVNKVRASSGSGLGLWISKKLVEAQGGRIWAESELMRGSRFYFSLPENEPKTA